MRYDIQVNVLDGLYQFQPFWINFREYYIGQGYNMEETEDIERALAEWSASNDLEDPDSPYFYFSDHRAYTLFMLRWS